VFVDEGAHVFFGRQDRLLQLFLGYLLAVDQVQRRIQRQFAHTLGFLGHGRVQRSIPNGFEAGHVPVETKDPDFMAHIGHFHRVRGAQRQGVSAAKEGVNVGITLHRADNECGRQDYFSFNEAGITSYWDWSMPRKIRELVRDLKNAGWYQVPGGKGDHRKFKHDKARIFVIIPDADHKDAKPYLEKQIRKAIDESSR